MWYWNPVNCNEAVLGVHDLANCIEIDEDEHPFKTGITPVGKKWDSDSFGFPVLVDIPPSTREELIAAAKQVRQQLLAHADAIMFDWRTELMLGEISDANRTKLSAWLAYKNDVKSVDVTIAPERVNWPALPEE